MADQPEPVKFSYDDLAKCAAREVALRRAVYKKRGMNASHIRELGMMEAIANHFMILASGAQPVEKDE